VRQVVGMFLMVFLKIFLIASLIAVPLAYFMAEYWLENFAYRSPLSPLIFVASLLGLWFLTLITVGYETWRAAVSNPVNSLRTEWDPVGKIILSKGVVTAHHPTIPLTFPPLIVWG